MAKQNAGQDTPMLEGLEDRTFDSPAQVSKAVARDG
jgi:hypothetical protein